MLFIFVLLSIIPSLLAYTFGHWTPPVLAGPVLALIVSYIAAWATNPGRRVPFSFEIRLLALGAYVGALLYFSYAGVTAP